MLPIFKCSLSRTIMLTLALFAWRPVALSACGAETDCQLGARTYRIMLPAGDNAKNRIGAIIFAHGFRGTAAEVMKSKGLIALASDLGLAFVAAQAAGPEWNIPNIPAVDSREGIDELSYFDSLMSDLVKRFNVDPSKTVVAGFSSGAMMVWHLACFRGDSFAGFVPMSGTFWEPVPEKCPAGPINLSHYHGRNDPVVPLHGRPIQDAHQGDVLEAVEMIARTKEYREFASDRQSDLDCSRWMDSSGHLLELCLFDGKHTFSLGNLSRAVRQFLAD